MAETHESLAWLARRDGRVLVGHGPFEAKASSEGCETAFFIQDFALQDTRPWKIPSRIERISAGAFPRFFPITLPPSTSWKLPEPAPFSEVFQEIMAAIHGGVFEKTVPVVTETGHAACAPFPSIPAALARQKAPLYSYGCVRDGGGFAGATPELLFSLDGCLLETMALAGTARSEDRDVFAVDEKEIREHEYVAQTLMSKLLGLGSLERKDRQILELGSIVHFLSLIRLRLDEEHSPMDLIRRLHPTPALGPLPRTEETMQQLLGWRRRLGSPAEFGAPFGAMDQGVFESIVAIRGVWWENDELKLPSGCGIIEASRLVNEWRELRLKREAVKQFLL
jgi:menaquinone-specific isochorismate synthase